MRICVGLREYGVNEPVFLLSVLMIVSAIIRMKRSGKSMFLMMTLCRRYFRVLVVSSICTYI